LGSARDPAARQPRSVCTELGLRIGAKRRDLLCLTATVPWTDDRIRFDAALLMDELGSHHGVPRAVAAAPPQLYRRPSFPVFPPPPSPPPPPGERRAPLCSFASFHLCRCLLAQLPRCFTHLPLPAPHLWPSPLPLPSLRSIRPGPFALLPLAFGSSRPPAALLLAP
jgi:hypothetical protein